MQPVVRFPARLFNSRTPRRCRFAPSLPRKWVNIIFTALRPMSTMSSRPIPTGNPAARERSVRTTASNGRRNIGTEMDDDRRYQHFLQRDQACDGKFLTGVLTTGIYCLPSCPARRPKRENVRFFRTPDEARESGLRPCHRCRPDWFYRGEEWYESLYEQTAARVRQ